MGYYWGENDVEKIKEFYYCASAATSGTTRSTIFVSLLPKFNYLISNCINATISSFSVIDKQEAQQELTTHIWEILSNRLKPDKLIGVQNYLWLSCRNYLYEIYRKKTTRKTLPITFTNDEKLLEHFGDINDNEIAHLTETELHQKILKGLDQITPKERNSKGNQLVLKLVKLLKQYLIENQFTQIDHFKDYAIKELNITNRDFVLASNKLHISTLLFKEKKIKKIIKKEYDAEFWKINKEKYSKKHRKKVIDEFY